jgi:hypothetical protein
MFQSILGRGVGSGPFARGGGDDSNNFSSDFPLDAITGLDVETLRNSFGDRYLELAGNLAHILTVARRLSLSKLRN